MLVKNKNCRFQLDDIRYIYRPTHERRRTVTIERDMIS